MKSIPLSVVSVGLMAVAAQAQAGVNIKVNEDSAQDSQVQEIMHALKEKNNANFVFQNTPEIAQALSENGEVLSISVDAILAGGYNHSSLSSSPYSNGVKGGNYEDDRSDLIAGGCHKCHVNCHSNCHSNCHGSRSWR